jgi:hypothetical protein
MIPKDPVILLSYINTQLRDFYKTLDDLCLSLDINIEELIEKLNIIDYHYNPTTNQFQ